MTYIWMILNSNVIVNAKTYEYFPFSWFLHLQINIYFITCKTMVVFIIKFSIFTHWIGCFRNLLDNRCIYIDLHSTVWLCGNETKNKQTNKKSSQSCNLIEHFWHLNVCIFFKSYSMLSMFAIDLEYFLYSIHCLNSNVWIFS